MRILDDALIAAATLSDRYINDRFLPDKAIDLVDEAASRLRMEMDSMPVEIDEATRQLTRMQIEAAALSKEAGAESQSRLQTLRKEIAEREDSVKALKARWEAEIYSKQDEAYQSFIDIREDAVKTLNEANNALAANKKVWEKDKKKNVKAQIGHLGKLISKAPIDKLNEEKAASMHEATEAVKEALR